MKKFVDPLIISIRALTSSLIMTTGAGTLWNSSDPEWHVRGGSKTFPLRDCTTDPAPIGRRSWSRPGRPWICRTGPDRQPAISWMNATSWAPAGCKRSTEGCTPMGWLLPRPMGFKAERSLVRFFQSIDDESHRGDLRNKWNGTDVDLENDAQTVGGEGEQTGGNDEPYGDQDAPLFCSIRTTRGRSGRILVDWRVLCPANGGNDHVASHETFDRVRQ